MTAKGLRLVQGGLPKDSPSSPSGLLAELYEKHAAAVYGRCRWLLRDPDEARDALQDVFVKVLQSMGEFRGAASPTTWILRIATHHCLNVLRARRAHWRDQLRELSKEKRHETESPDRREMVRAVLAAAPDEAQEVAVLYFVDELTQQEIAAELGRSLPTVRKRLREFLACGRQMLGVEVASDDF
ncbi:MAG TPA: sigma-70 family RNA polymerase sigma factor [Myxococcales bacterium]|nr:sigma-70 family RNA polymerase sigma factor [Myxococcales bacterium]